MIAESETTELTVLDRFFNELIVVMGYSSTVNLTKPGAVSPAHGFTSGFSTPSFAPGGFIRAWCALVVSKAKKHLSISLYCPATPTGRDFFWGGCMNKVLEKLYKQQRGLCIYCGQKAYPNWISLDEIKEVEGLTKNSEARQLIANTDHMKPRSFGGSNAQYNLVMSHVGCNSRKGEELKVKPVTKVLQMLPKHKKEYALSLFWGLA